jgi:diguanylate cyclase (GGDEF)-like protein/PAS domain S-box-containing protein
VATSDDVAEARRVADLFQTTDPLFRALIESSSDIVSVTRVSGNQAKLLYVSPSVESVLGYEPDEFISMDVESIIDDALMFPLYLGLSVLGQGETSAPVVIPVRHRDGSRRWLEVRSTNLMDDPAVRGVVSNARDVSDRRLAEEELERTRVLTTSVLETANDAYMQFDYNGRVITWNRQAERTFGWSRMEAIGRQLDELIVPKQYREVFRADMEEATQRKQTLEGKVMDNLEFTALRRDGTEFPIEVTSWATPGVDGVRLNAFIRDITERKTLENRLSHEALHDVLTGLPNRSLLKSSLQDALHRAGRSRLRVAVLFCDLDQFKVINDSLGHSVGDELLCAVARRLEQSIRLGDTISRFGGDEFVIVLDGVVDAMEASTLAERVLGTFRHAFPLVDYELFVTASIGVAVGLSSSDPEELLADADAAMYRAKEKGRARLELFDATLRRRVRLRHDLQQALGLALERDELELLYQPVVSLADGAIVGAEALLRWQRPGHGLVEPADFLGLASDTGLIVPIGAWVLETACRQLRRWELAVPDRAVTMSVNVSARRLASSTMVDHLSQVLTEVGCDPDGLTLELTETALMGDVDAVLPILVDLRSTGVHLAIDDFGAGRSSLGTLRRFPVDTLKIDKSFVDNLSDDPYDAALVAAISTMGTMLGHTIVAKGVETLETAQLVRGHHCEFAQGYYFSRPLTADRFLDLVCDGAHFDLDLSLG